MLSNPFPVGPIDRKLVSFDISWMIRVTLDPFKNCLNSQRVALINLGKNTLDKIFVFHRFPSRSLPSIFTPVDAPNRHAVDRIATICYYTYIAIPWNNL